MKVDLGFDSAGSPGGIARVVALLAPRWPRALASFRDDLVTTIFPAECRCCEGPLESLSTVPVCTGCLARIVPSTLPACWRCGEGLEHDPELLRFQPPETILCRECTLAPPDFTRAVSFGTYQAELRELIRLLKFERVQSVAALLAPHLAGTVLSLESGFAPQPDLLVVAVPLFAQRRRQRGYNQSVLIADAAVVSLRRMRPAWQLSTAHTLLQRQRSTESSFVLSRRQRRRNLRGAFRLRPGAEALLQRREVLLIDDILTSGATARECARILLRGGAAKVWVVTLARAQKQSVLDLHEQPTAPWDLALTLSVNATPTSKD